MQDHSRADGNLDGLASGESGESVYLHTLLGINFWGQEESIR